MVPSNTKINAVLSDLTTKGYIKYIKEGNKTLFFINPDFFDVWEKRYEQLIEEAVDERKAKIGLNQERDIKKAIHKLYEFGSHEFSLDELKNFVLKKYGPIIYEFFFLDTAYSADKESLLILKYSNEIATYTPY